MYGIASWGEAQTDRWSSALNGSVLKRDGGGDAVKERDGEKYTVPIQKNPKTLLFSLRTNQ